MALDEEIRQLRRKTDSTRATFIRAELQTCTLALEVAEYQLSMGKLDVVKREVASVLEGISALQRVLREASAEQQIQVKAEVMQLQARLKPLQLELQFHPRDPEAGTS